MNRLWEAAASRYRKKGAKGLAHAGINYGLRQMSPHQEIDKWCYNRSLRTLRAHQQTESGLDDILDTTSRFTGWGRYETIRPLQVRSELREFAETIAERSPERVMEVGSANGGTLYVWSRYLDSAETILSLDLPGGEFGGGYDAPKAQFMAQFNPVKRFKFVRDNSHALSTKRTIQQELDGPVDFLFIDGEHTYGGVKADFEMYADLVRDGGVIAFHDILPHEDSPNCEVDILWNELKDRYETEEIIEDENQGWAGIGLLYV